MEMRIFLLTNNITCSGGEIFSLAMKQRENLVHIGSQTKGCTGAIVTRDLLNGWNFLIPSSKTTTADGTDYFKSIVQKKPYSQLRLLPTRQISYIGHPFTSHQRQVG